MLDWSLEDGEALQKQFQEVLRIDPKFSSEHVANIYSFKNQANLELVVGSLRKAGLK